MILWKYLNTLQKNNKEQGFTIPLILGFGLFMLAIALTSIKTSSTSEVDSKVQEKTLQASAAAEVGVARYQELLDKTRTLAVYSDCVTTHNSDGECQDTTEPSWANATKTVSAGGTKTCGGILAVPDPEVLAEESTIEWKDVDPNEPSKGQYRLLRYRYKPADNSSGPYSLPGVGILEVEGRTNQFTTEATIEDDEVLNTSTARLQLEIPIDKNTNNDGGQLPGLWMGFDTDADMGSQKVAGSIFIEDLICTAAGAPPVNVTKTGNITPGDHPTWDVKSTPEAIPETPPLPPDNELNKITSAEIFKFELPRVKDDTSFDVSGAIAPESDFLHNGSYHYLISELDNTDFNPGEIRIKPGQSIVLHVQGSIKLTGSINGSGTPANLKIYGNTTVGLGAGYDDTDWKYGCGDKFNADNVNLGQADCPTQVINLTGGANVRGFVHAPEAIGCLAEANGGSITGALWLRQWTVLHGVCAGGTDETIVTLDPTVIPITSSEFARAEVVEPMLAPLTSWRRVDRN